MSESQAVDEDEQESEQSDPEETEQESAEQEQAEQEQEQTEEAEQEQEQAEQDAEEQDGDDEQQAHQETHSHDPPSAEMTDETVTDPETVDADVDTDHDAIEGVLGIRKTVQSTAGQLIGREFDAVSEIAPTDDGWRAVVEVVERRSVPDTQDVIGRYEVELDTEGTVHGYRRLDRYRRGDTASFE